MVDQQQQDQADIAAEQYRGANPRLAALGQGAIQHLLWAAAGLAIVGTAALAAPMRAKSFIEATRNHAKSMTGKMSKGSFLSDRLTGFQKGWGEMLYTVFGEGAHVRSLDVNPVDKRHIEWVDHALSDKQHGFGHWFVGHTFGIIPWVGQLVRKWLKSADNATDQRYINALTLGGGGAAVGYVSGWAVALTGVAKPNHEGRDQVERLQREIIDLRTYQNSQVGNDDYANQSPSTTTEPNATAVMGEVAANGHAKNHHTAVHATHHDQAHHEHAHDASAPQHAPSPHHDQASNQTPQTSIDATSAHYAGMHQAAAQHAVGVPI